MKTHKPLKETVKFGGAVVRIKERKNGLFDVRWREGGKGRGTCITTLEKAREVAKKTARRLASGAGKIVAAEDHELLERVKAVAGTRSPFAVLNQLDMAVRRLGSWDAVERALTFYEQSGMADVQPVAVQEARLTFLGRYEEKSAWTLSGLRKELNAFDNAHPGMMTTELGEDILRGWIGRGQPAPRFFNNRLATWKTFLNFCREKNWWPRGEKHPAEQIDRKDLPDKSPEILTPAQAHGILKLLPETLVPYFAIGCWLGLRPTEILRLRWEHFDWEGGYLHLPVAVVQKTLRERYVPLNDKARELLIHWRGEQGKCSILHAREEISKLAREKEIISEWPQDVMRHSYISYRLALGDSRSVVAEQAGNSESEIRKSYRRPLRREDGEAWFSIS